ncbi:MAG: hypothetical protein ACRDPY_42895 [Streptosporangiaceae bacterium]
MKAYVAVDLLTELDQMRDQAMEMLPGWQIWYPAAWPSAILVGVR